MFIVFGPTACSVFIVTAYILLIHTEHFPSLTSSGCSPILPPSVMCFWDMVPPDRLEVTLVSLVFQVGQQARIGCNLRNGEMEKKGSIIPHRNVSHLRNVSQASNI